MARVCPGMRLGKVYICGVGVGRFDVANASGHVLEAPNLPHMWVGGASGKCWLWRVRLVAFFGLGGVRVVRPGIWGGFEGSICRCSKILYVPREIKC